MDPYDIMHFACENADNKAEQPLSPAGIAEQVQKVRSKHLCDRILSGLLQAAFFIAFGTDKLMN